MSLVGSHHVKERPVSFNWAEPCARLVGESMLYRCLSPGCGVRDVTLDAAADHVINDHGWTLDDLFALAALNAWTAGEYQ